MGKTYRHQLGKFVSLDAYKQTRKQPIKPSQAFKRKDKRVKHKKDLLDED